MPMSPLTRPTRACLSLALLNLILLASARPAAAGLINGNFETGDFTGWTLANAGAGPGGSFFIDTPGSTTPLSGFPTAPNAAGGSFYAVCESDFPGQHALLRNFTI